jgi:hypothetical protein
MNENQEDRSIKAKDKLTYKNVLQNLVALALASLGTIHLEDRVVALRTGMLFDIPGMPLQTKINTNLKRLKFERAVKIGVIKRLYPGHWEHRGKRAYYELILNEEFFTDELHFLINLLSQHNALVETRDFVESGEMSDSEP